MRFVLSVETKVGDKLVPVLSARFESSVEDAEKLIAAFNMGIYNSAVRIGVVSEDPDPPAPAPMGPSAGPLFQC